MKRFFIVCLLGLAACVNMHQVKAQNVQLLYDTGRNSITSTVEMFRPDSFGSTYFFVDIDYSPRAVGAYWEISRELCFWQDTDWSWLSAHVEYNGGLTNTMSFDNAWLAGATYSGHSADFTKTWSLSALYKAIPGTIGLNGKKQVHNFQITGVWGINFAHGWCDFSGFFDFWRQAYPWQGTKYIFMSEPQFWVNLNKIKGMENVNLSVGGEVELSVNFARKGFAALPAVGAKWTF